MPATPQQIAEKLELLPLPLRETVFELINRLLNQSEARGSADKKGLLLQTSVWSEDDVRNVREAQEAVNRWRIPI